MCVYIQFLTTLTSWYSLPSFLVLDSILDKQINTNLHKKTVSQTKPWNTTQILNQGGNQTSVLLPHPHIPNSFYLGTMALDEGAIKRSIDCTVIFKIPIKYTCTHGEDVLIDVILSTESGIWPNMLNGIWQNQNGEEHSGNRVGVEVCRWSNRI